MDGRIDFTQIPIIDVARELLGNESKDRSSAKERHFAGHSGLFVNIDKNLWYSHGQTTGGDVAGLIKHVTGGDFTSACSWLEEHGYTSRNAPTNGRAPTAKRIVATYPYVDEVGDLLFQAVRYDPKDFRQRRPDGAGDWIWNLGDTRRVLYRLPELLEAVAVGRPIFVAEGEKDVDALVGIGVTATCNPMGAGKWRGEWGATYSETLRGADVVILPDNDDEGEKHGAQVAEALAGVAARVRVLRLPGLSPKGDPFDWIAAGGTAAALWKMVEVLQINPQVEAPTEQPAAVPRKQPKVKSWPSLDAEAAYYGLGGDVVSTISPESEADPVALLIQFLACAGNIIGRKYYYLVESDRHHANLFADLVGQSSKARKGTSLGRILAIAKGADLGWAADRTTGGLSSGEGLINQVRDPVQKWDPKENTFTTIDPGVTDKRLLVVEPEFVSALAVMERHGNTLSPLLRKAWDGHKLCTLTRASPLSADGAHISIVGHVTETELRARLTRTDAANGFANRFLFVLVQRFQELPFGGNLSEEDIDKLGSRFKAVIDALAAVDTPRKVTLDHEARELWQQEYSRLSADRGGLVGAITARAEAQTIRLAMIYALLDKKVSISRQHLEAGLSVWNYCQASAEYIFGDATGDPVIDTIVAALRAAPDGMSRTQISDLFGRHETSESISTGLATVLAKGLAWSETRGTGGRPIETWRAVKGADHAK